MLVARFVLQIYKTILQNFEPVAPAYLISLLAFLPTLASLALLILTQRNIHCLH